MRRDENSGGNGSDPGRPARSGPLTSPKVWAGAILTVLFLVFIAQNHERVDIDYIFFTKASYLIWVMLACGLIGFVVGWLWGRPGRADAKRRRKEPKKG